MKDAKEWGNRGMPTPIGGFGHELTEYRTCRQRK